MRCWQSPSGRAGQPERCGVPRWRRALAASAYDLHSTLYLLLSGLKTKMYSFYRPKWNINMEGCFLVTKIGRILLANLHQSSRSTLSWGSFLNFFAFKEDMLSTLISVLGGWPTVS